MPGVTASPMAMLLDRVHWGGRVPWRQLQQSSPGHTSRSSSWRGPSSGTLLSQGMARVSSTEQFARAGLARLQLSVWVPGKMIQKGREEGKVPFEKWQGQQESCEGEAY